MKPKHHLIHWHNKDGSQMECLLEMSQDSARVVSVNQIDVEVVKPKPPKKVTQKKECKGCSNLSKVKNLITGSVKLLKSELGVDGTNSDELESRKKICLGCDKYDFGVCTSCGCFLSAKVKLKTEQCPEGKW